MIERIEKRIKAYKSVIFNITENDTNSDERIATYKAIICELENLLKYNKIIS